MIFSRVELQVRSALPAVLLLASVGLIGCGSPAPNASSPPAATPVPPPAAAASNPAKPATPPAPPVALTPLATPQQVVEAIPVGRPDPFAPAQSQPELGPTGKPTGQPARPKLPAGFRLTGVIRTGGQSQAFVQIGDQSGPLCLGARGRCAGPLADQPLLPPGWRVTGIDAVNGLLALSFGGFRQVVPLAS